MPIGIRSKRIIDEYLDRIGVNTEFTVREIFANLDCCKSKPNTREIAGYLKKFATICDYRYYGGDMVAFWVLVV